jgi:hypothetical protein
VAARPNGSADVAIVSGTAAAGVSALRPEIDPNQARPHASTIARQPRDQPKNPI